MKVTRLSGELTVGRTGAQRRYHWFLSWPQSTLSLQTSCLSTSSLPCSGKDWFLATYYCHVKVKTGNWQLLNTELGGENPPPLCVLLHYKPVYCVRSYFRHAYCASFTNNSMFGVSIDIKKKQNTVCDMHRHNHS